MSRGSKGNNAEQKRRAKERNDGKNSSGASLDVLELADISDREELEYIGALYGKITGATSAMNGAWVVSITIPPALGIELARVRQETLGKFMLVDFSVLQPPALDLDDDDTADDEGGE
jgi:hypothetical protein